ncbi:hypothetical protein CFOL_v3_19832 [Cephalotus follicularis]|uniref:CCHC-type domain-containing protein n=1 Tax=Cephalotus follicularis TaxID=3775 RepID=A0A1Q3C7W2_CEPFO|nr:hypothetical protein CFOL_v3_19832 [Cephalotus follicularis]
MKLCREFEYARSSLLNRSPVPSLSTCLNDVLLEEQRLSTQHLLDAQSRFGPSEVAFAAISKPGGKDMSKIQCYSCHEYGHYASHCKKKKVCNYYKSSGHVISQCTRQPQNRTSSSGQAFHTPVVPPTEQVAGSSSISPEVLQQMIQTNNAAAFSSMGLSGKPHVLSTKWYFDFGASHHMTRNAKNLVSFDVTPSVPTVSTAEGQNMLVHAMGSLPCFISQPSLRLSNVLYIPQLSTNLLSVGQLVDNNCTVFFSSHDCVIQDQGQVTEKGKKEGSWFSMDLHHLPIRQTSSEKPPTGGFAWFTPCSTYSL